MLESSEVICDYIVVVEISVVQVCARLLPGCVFSRVTESDTLLSDASYFLYCLFGHPTGIPYATAHTVNVASFFFGMVSPMLCS